MDGEVVAMRCGWTEMWEMRVRTVRIDISIYDIDAKARDQSKYRRIVFAGTGGYVVMST